VKVTVSDGIFHLDISKTRAEKFTQLLSLVMSFMIRIAGVLNEIAIRRGHQEKTARF